MTGYGAVIVAAGISSRMGDFKPLLPAGGESMIRRAVHTMQAAGADPVVVVAGYRHEDVEAHLKDSGVTVLENTNYVSTKMLDSVLIGLEYLRDKCGRALITPADVPFVQPGTIKEIVRREGEFIRPVFHGEAGHPVLLDLGLLAVIKDYAGQGGLNGAVEAGYINAGDVETDDPGILMDADTREDYEKLLCRQTELDAGRSRLRMEIQLKLGTDEIFFSPATAQFLELVDHSGSVEDVSQAMHMTCRDGWDILERMERKLGYAVVEPKDSSNGMRYCLTGKGRWFLNAYQSMRAEMLDRAEASLHRHFKDRLELCG